MKYFIKLLTLEIVDEFLVCIYIYRDSLFFSKSSSKSINCTRNSIIVVIKSCLSPMRVEAVYTVQTKKSYIPLLIGTSRGRAHRPTEKSSCGSKIYKIVCFIWMFKK